ncbi:EscV/YscV/HrcV family type III secretion system export apparatus protein [Morganella psychrotolerans]|uniref:EscV/YscV/HrcV family type III secretion system export apparatus protein n=1 Tax=Morganella psychrotolerans TaxID=368603 RepID=A0A5M9R4D5_9GAMM|nr:EscV/YscV/HrcV family type III secretion system export apparatus protein [Morganella psychrotolerans]KAA8715423.1 EscV/YscV/HrcV family type III secretion system export apparatus protein [Morganella psychrotolerans]
MLTSFINAVKNKPELSVLLIMIMVIAMLIIPLPKMLVDFLIGLNIVISILMLLLSFYITRILGFTSFPALLLITTLFRLALSISTSRLILLDADAGNIIQSFGDFVIGENIVVGFVIFAIVTIVQFIVITKGSERVAEVAARFSLDGMPGKQMSIDADLKSGLIDNEEVRKRRKELEQESQMYGAFDGAMKFIKGDAIAGIVIIFVNFAGGIGIGVAQMSMPFSEALSTYTLLTIGDGLVAQIPALLIAISAGFIVTRVSGTNQNLGANIVRELFSHDFTLLVTAVLALCMGMLPGFPAGIFGLLGGGLLVFYVSRMRQRKRQDAAAQKEGCTNAVMQEAQPSSENTFVSRGLTAENNEAIPLIITLHASYQTLFETKNIIAWLQEEFAFRYGFFLSGIIMNYSHDVSVYQSIVLINEIQSGTINCYPDKYKIIKENGALDSLNIEPVVIELKNGRKTYWADKKQCELCHASGMETEPGITVFFNEFSRIMTRHIQELLGIQETKTLLDNIENKYPELLKECYRYLSVQRVADVFQRLISEQISIRNIKTILGALVQWGQKEKDTLILVEHVRSQLARYISDRFTRNQVLHAVVLSNPVEEMVRQGIRQSAAGTFINLEPAQLDHFYDAMSVVMEPLREQQDIVLLTAMDIRRFVKKLIELHYPDVAVLSFSEIVPTTQVSVIESV